MLLKNHLIEVFKKASLEKNFLLKEDVVLKWVHRFGINSLNDLLIHSPVQKENHYKENQEQISLIDEEHEENQEQISLIDEEHEENQEQVSLIDEEHEENQEQIRLESFKTSENSKETQFESHYLEVPINNEIFNTSQDSSQINKYTKPPKLPLPYIKNLRKWINKDKKAS